MISPEVLRRFPFFAGLSHEHLVALADLAEESSVDEGARFFREGDLLEAFYLNLEGTVGIFIELPAKAAAQTVAGQLTGEFPTKDVVISSVGPGDAFGWSGLVSPFQATASAKALTPCQVLSFDCQQLRQLLDDDCELGYRMTQRAAEVMISRLRDLRIESLASMVD